MSRVILLSAMLILGISLILFSGQLTSFISRDTPPNQSISPLGQIQSVQGPVKIWADGKFLEASPRRSLFPMNQITVPNKSSITIGFPSGYRIKFLENSALQLLPSHPSLSQVTLIRLFSGNFTVLRKGRTKFIKIEYQGELYSPENFSTTPISKLKIISTRKKKPTNLLAPLTNDSLKQAIKDQKGYLYIQRCYASYLRRYPNLKNGGKITVHFIALPKGVLANTKILNSSFINAKDFHRCVQTIFNRIRIKPFPGEAIDVSYPLNLF